VPINRLLVLFPLMVAMTFPCALAGVETGRVWSAQGFNRPVDRRRRLGLEFSKGCPSSRRQQTVKKARATRNYLWSMHLRARLWRHPVAHRHNGWAFTIIQNHRCVPAPNQMPRDLRRGRQCWKPVVMLEVRESAKLRFRLPGDAAVDGGSAVRICPRRVLKLLAYLAMHRGRALNRTVRSAGLGLALVPLDARLGR
jgi:hypothetical protein